MGAPEPARPFRVVDAHCHVPSGEFVPAPFLDSTIDNVLLRLGRYDQAAQKAAHTLADRLLDDRHCDRLINDMDAAGIDHAVLIVPDFTIAFPDCPLSIAEQLNAVVEIRDRHEGRFEAFAGVDPRWGEDGLVLLERALREQGFRGMKVYPPCGFSPSDRRLYPYYELCASLEAPVMVHIGGTSHHLNFEPARPIHLDQAARDFPRLPFLIAHAGTTYPEESVLLAAFRPNVFLEVSGFQAHYSAPLSDLTSKGVGHKLIFGTDWPVFGLHATLADTVAQLLDHDASLGHLKVNDVEMFFGGTIERLLSLCNRRIAS
jgi:predicted TIM-barrel fold metal-dependent hydrolase